MIKINRNVKILYSIDLIYFGFHLLLVLFIYLIKNSRINKLFIVLVNFHHHFAQSLSTNTDVICLVALGRRLCDSVKIILHYCFAHKSGNLRIETKTTTTKKSFLQMPLLVRLLLLCSIQLQLTERSSKNDDASASWRCHSRT